MFGADGSTWSRRLRKKSYANDVAMELGARATLRCWETAKRCDAETKKSIFAFNFCVCNTDIHRAVIVACGRLTQVSTSADGVDLVRQRIRTG